MAVLLYLAANLRVGLAHYLAWLPSGCLILQNPVEYRFRAGLTELAAFVLLWPIQLLVAIILRVLVPICDEILTRLWGGR